MNSPSLNDVQTTEWVCIYCLASAPRKDGKHGFGSPCRYPRQRHEVRCITPITVGFRESHSHSRPEQGE